jgi:hypothetical protein
VKAFRQTLGQLFRQIRLWAIIFVVSTGALGSAISAQEPYEDYGGASLLVLKVDSINCTAQLVLDAAIVNSYAQVLGFRTIMSVGTTVYVDSLVVNDFIYEELTAKGVLPVAYNNSGGTATAAPPIPAGQVISVTIQILANNVTPIWETRFTVTDCDSGAISQFPVSGEVDNLVQNIGFEWAGETDKLPAQWESLVDNDKRLCNDALIVAAHSGNCAYQFKANPNTKAKIQQISLLNPTGLQGDRLDLGAWAKADGLSVGSEVKMVVKYPTQPKVKLIVPIPEGSYDYTFISVPSINLPETPTKVKVSIQSKGEGSFVIDDVLAQRVINGAPQLSSGLIPLPGVNAVDLTRPQ